MNQYIETLLKFMPKNQAQCFLSGLSNQESHYFQNVAKNISKVISKAPTIYETDGRGDKVKPVLHYFCDDIDIFITEIDKTSNELYGYTSLGFGYLESGYIDLDYIFETLPHLNLDFNFKPKTITEYKREFEG